MSVVHRLKAYEYTQVLDNNTSNTFTLLGPLSFTPKEHHHVLHNPKKCIVVPPNHFVTIDNPVVHDNKWEEKELNSVDFPFGVVSGNPTTIRVPLGAKCLMGKKEIRFSQAPFPLIDSEVSGAVQPMPLLSANDALVLEATEDFEEVRPDKTKVKRNEKDRFLFRGPGLYTPQLREKQVGRIKATTVAPNEALHLQVKQTFTDDDGAVRVEGTEWTEKGINLYFIHPFVKLVKVIKSFMLDSVTALKVTALDSFFDETFKVQRNVGDQWLVQENDVKGEYLPSHMENVQVMELITLTRHQYCVVHNPYKDGKVQRGTREIRTGPCSFFLQPEEILAGRESVMPTFCPARRPS
ncbi:major vault protein-like protein [Angomonas deanei]|uniref:Major Vault Protein repeat domain containing protein, putative n=1 Tax=Angomonas deanei TaxID=59799 RepID=A0A7G2CM20_9TRYP|nr:major vault protein-like protein [Angomonas deanei]CAD2220888.1 Major Vault Protein repeat domain containing protein, putative [Angomonas deanei]|eukprot:EPY39334.1 major vault protein-like protein [Angomonas deanei]